MELIFDAIRWLSTGADCSCAASCESDSPDRLYRFSCLATPPDAIRRPSWLNSKPQMMPCAELLDDSLKDAILVSSAGMGLGWRSYEACHVQGFERPANLPSL